MFTPDRAGGMRFFGAFAALAGLILLAFALVELRRDTSLSSRGARVQGVVVGHDRDVDTSSQTRLTTYSLTVRYGASQRQFPVSQYVYDHTAFGAPVQVVYDPSQPESARLASDLSSGSAYKLPGAFALVLLAVAVGFFVAASRKPPEVMDLDEALSRARRPGV